VLGAGSTSRDTVLAVGVATRARERPGWRSVAVPSEHGGWGLTLEPILLGLLVAPSAAGAALATAAMLAFVVRTPLKMVLVDRWRRRWLPRTGVAAGIASGELAAMAGFGLLACRWAGWSWLAPAVLAVPLVLTEVWFDMRSRGRRLGPELCGAVGITAVVAAMIIAGGETGRLAAALWLVLAARAVMAIPFVRVQITRLRHGAGAFTTSDTAQLVGIVLAMTALAFDVRVVAGSIAAVGLALVHLVWVRRPPRPAKVLGMCQLVVGLGLVAVTAAGVLAA